MDILNAREYIENFLYIKTKSGDICRLRMNPPQRKLYGIIKEEIREDFLRLVGDRIARGIRRIEPVEHRLQLIPGQITVIDDAFNSNPSGSAEALNVLSGFRGRRIIVTPGMVEQGENEDNINYAFGAQMPGKVDYAILVGPKHTAPIRSGMIEAGFDEDHIFTVTDLTEATGELRKLGRPGDVVLFENDLPDNYHE